MHKEMQLHKSKGMTFIGMLFILAVVVILGIITMRIVPVYLQHYAVLRSITALESLPSDTFTEDKTSNIQVIRSRLINQFDVNGLSEITNDQILIKPKEGNAYDIAVSYKVVRPLVANISLMFDFNVLKEVKVGPS